MDDVMANEFVDFFVNLNAEQRYVTWHQRIVSSSMPSVAVNLKGATVDAAPSEYTDPTKRVSEMPAYFTNRGKIPFMIQRAPGMDLNESEYFEEVKGNFIGTCAIGYQVEKEDHVVDLDNREYRVEHATNISRFFRHFRLIYLPGSAY